MLMTLRGRTDYRAIPSFSPARPPLPFFASWEKHTQRTAHSLKPGLGFEAHAQHLPPNGMLKP